MHLTDGDSRNSKLQYVTHDSEHNTEWRKFA